MGAFGEKLRKQREQQGITLDAISNNTKIGVRMLRALEEEHFEQLPGGVFNKGFVRAYARHVGLNEEEAIAEYLDALRESQIHQQAIMPDLRSGERMASGAYGESPHFRGERSTQSADVGSSHQARHEVSNLEPALSGPGRDRSRSSSPEIGPDLEPTVATIPFGPETSQLHQRSSPEIPARPTPWMTLVFALALVVVGLVLWHFIRRHETSAGVQTRAAQQQPVAISSTAQPLESATAGSPNRTSTVLSSAGSQKAPIAVHSKNQAINPAPNNAAAGRFATGAALEPPSSAAPANSSVLTSKKVASVTQPATFTLFIRAEKTTWVAIMADGKEVTQETLIAPAHTSVRATKEIVVKAGNAAGIIFELNGKQVGEPGADGQVKTYVFDANGIETAEHMPETLPSPNP